ncbi:MAG TPA: tRNA (adenosine(37)-N6)-threonylcarbamoyltransferase complex ATPase subunit type 1 TsaE [Bacteroidales bacterium]|nr:tRNA (adenosine(37)-N6)-threonylcarbamoyltransferase complex ATPase subunit type 1 TsaE [Bacteroidales bacterium]
MKTIEIRSLHQLNHAAHEFVQITRGHRKFAFYGAMGSGKTTFIKAICRQLGATDVVTSPTFALINEYRTGNGENLFHFDLYRINAVEELYDLGYEEYFFSDSIIFIEWPEKAEALLPDGIIKVYMEESGTSGRLVHIAT